MTLMTSDDEYLLRTRLALAKKIPYLTRDLKTPKLIDSAVLITYRNDPVSRLYPAVAKCRFPD